MNQNTSQSLDKSAWLILVKRFILSALGGIFTLAAIVGWAYLCGAGFLAFGKWLATEVITTEFRAFFAFGSVIVLACCGFIYLVWLDLVDRKNAIKKELSDQCSD